MNKISKSLRAAYIYIVGLAVLFVPALAMADIQVIPNPSDVPAGPNIGTVSPASIVALVFRITIEIAGAIFLLMLLFGGVTYLTSAGNEEGTGKAKKMMISAVIGLVIILVSYSVGIFILKALGYTI